VRLEQALNLAIGSVSRAASPTESVDVHLGADSARAVVQLGTGGPLASWLGAGCWCSGADLPLYLTRGLVEAHGGTVACEQTAGGGLRVQIEIPLNTSPGH
jgi:hypothetical protein